MLLKQLVAIESVYNNSKGIDRALTFCKKHFQKVLPDYATYFDKAGNLICVSKEVDRKKNILFFSSHIDTVGADKKDWDAKYNPFIPYEDDKEIVGRGVNDCKAGVAYQLLLASYIATHSPDSTQLVFTITRREENGGDSSAEIGRQIGRKLPSSKKMYLLTLENNMRVTPAELAVNYAERGAVGLEVTCTIEEMKRLLKKDKNEWNPTNTRPVKAIKNATWENLTQMGGHAGTVPREKNLLYHVLKDIDNPNAVFVAGDGKTVSISPKLIQKAYVVKPVKHTIILDLRTYKKVPELTKELQKYGFAFRFIKIVDFGYDVEKRLYKDAIYPVLQKASNPLCKVIFEMNPATTDTGRIYSSCSLDVQKKLLPLTMGPGSRSQREKIPPRLSHGVNETFNKKTGRGALASITQVLLDMGFLGIENI